ncbi:Genetic suppressor element 1, partial [Ophiophagus hannah]
MLSCRAGEWRHVIACRENRHAASENLVGTRAVCCFFFPAFCRPCSLGHQPGRTGVVWFDGVAYRQSRLCRATIGTGNSVGCNRSNNRVFCARSIRKTSVSTSKSRQLSISPNFSNTQCRPLASDSYLRRLPCPMSRGHTSYDPFGDLLTSKKERKKDKERESKREGRKEGRKERKKERRKEGERERERRNERQRKKKKEGRKKRGRKEREKEREKE